jgi:hypothetical protein
VKTLNKKQFDKPIELGNYVVRWDEERNGARRTLATCYLKGERSFDTMAIVQLSSSEAEQLGLRTALGAITGRGS